MGYCKELDSATLKRIIHSIRSNDEKKEESVFLLIQYLTNGAALRRSVYLSEEKFWDFTTEIYCQLKKRLDPTSPHVKEWTPVEDLVAYIYFAVPRWFCRACEKAKKIDDFRYACVDIEEPWVEAECIADDHLIADDCINTEHMIKAFIGEATTNAERRKRISKVRNVGYEIVGDNVQVVKMTRSKIEKQILHLESLPIQTLPKLEERRQRAIVRFRGMLDQN